MVPEFVFYPAAASGRRHRRPGGSKWNRALPGRKAASRTSPQVAKEWLPMTVRTVRVRIQELEETSRAL